jgi:signal transduction histidine kinase
MENNGLPYEHLFALQEQVGWSRDEMRVLLPYRQAFIDRKDEFAGFFYNYFYQIPRSRVVLHHEKMRGELRRIWSRWFESLFNVEGFQSLLSDIWKSGLKHVEFNLDQQYVNLGYCLARQFCHQIVCSVAPISSRAALLLSIDKLLDLCLLIETSAYVAFSSRCDQEVIKGISHQLRNPITVIGGSARRVQKILGPENELHGVCENIIYEIRRLDRLVVDIGVYMEVFQRESRFLIVSLGEVIENALQLLKRNLGADLPVQMDLDDNFSDVQGDPDDLETMFYYLLENSFEALRPGSPPVSIRSSVESFASHFLNVEIFNTGAVPKPEEVDSLFTPFYSSKPTGTGFGLPIALLASRKNLASVTVRPIPEQGTRCLVQLPLPS